jgi:hypothetical protein
MTIIEKFTRIRPASNQCSDAAFATFTVAMPSTMTPSQPI